MDCVRVLLADSDREYLMKNSRKLSGMPGIKVVGTAVDGGEVIRDAKRKGADVIVTELALTGVDGLGVLEAVKDMGTDKPKVIVLTNMTSNRIMNYAVELGASYYLVKPVEMAILSERIRFLTRDTYEEEREDFETDERKRVRSILRDMGFATVMKGCRCLEEAVLLRNENEEKYSRLTSCMYPKIAEINGVSTVCVERSIRTAIASAWNKGNLQRYAAMTSNTDWGCEKPTAGQMIERISVLSKTRASHFN